MVLRKRRKKRPLVRTLVKGFRNSVALAARARLRRLMSALELGPLMVPEYFTHPANGMHRWLTESLLKFTSVKAKHRKQGANYCVIAPRGSAKSTIATFLIPLVAILNGTEPFILILSDTEKQAADRLRDIRLELEENDWIRENYPWAFGEGSVWNQQEIVTKNGVRVVARGSGSGLRGLRERSQRPTLVITDDPEGDKHRWSESAREHTRNWFFDSVLKVGQASTIYVVVGTVLHDECLVNYLLEQQSGWRSRKFRAIESWPTAMDTLWHQWREIFTDRGNPIREEEALAFYERNRTAMHAGAELLWPERLDLLTLMIARVNGGDDSFDQEYQGEPKSLEASIFPRIYFGDWLWWEAWPEHRHMKHRVVTLDPSLGKRESGDYSAIVKTGYMPESGLVVAQADVKKRRHTPRMVSDTVDAALEHKAELIVVESNGFQELLLPFFKEEVEKRAGDDGFSIRVLPIKNFDYSKAARIRSLEPLLSSKRIRLVRGRDTWVLEKQLKRFPEGHDDAPDALEMGVRTMKNMSHGAHQRKAGEVLVLAA